jgi:orotidine-5'-phosphate decarboxylase
MAEVIIPLDFDSSEEALRLVDVLGADAGFYKVGFELYTRAGPAVIEALTTREKRVFLDLKLHDIPNTVAGGVRGARDLGVELLTVHIAGGAAMLQAAVEASGPDLHLLGVTVLTSLTPEDMETLWGREIRSIREEVGRLTGIAMTSGVSGVVASPLEASWIRKKTGDDFLIVTPGIRPEGSDPGDQNRVATPAAAVAAGSDYLVIGRAITQAADPSAALQSVLAEVRAVSSVDG